ncbi:MAG: pyridoxal-dependent decarboxylase [Acidocella sp.]|nr:pyridoxal-dependent decarboxylase [Acidocella sp.]
MPYQSTSLDPTDWRVMRAAGHRMMDDMFDHLANLRGLPVWQPMPADVRAAFSQKLPTQGQDVEALYESFRNTIQPYVSGNTHPHFMGWVQGGGNVVSMLAELLAGAMNENCGGRDHVGLSVERQVIAWAAEITGMPPSTSGVLLTGSSMANFIAVLCARTKALGQTAREEGIKTTPLVAYASQGVHRCVPGALDMAGLGFNALRKIPVDADYRMNIPALRAAIKSDRAAGKTPFLIVGTAGSVDVGAFDDLAALSEIAKEFGLWFHVDGAFGALGCLSPSLRPQLAGIAEADSIALDFHKWAQVTYDAGCILIRDSEVHIATFSQATSYLAAAPRGLAGGQPWPCDLGPDLSRSFRALKIWMTISAYGSEKLGHVIDHSCALAKHLSQRIEQSDVLELSAPVPLNIVCFRVKHYTDTQNANLVADLQEAGLFAPSTTILNDQLAIRAAIVNHRTQISDIDALVDEITRRAVQRAN